MSTDPFSNLRNSPPQRHFEVDEQDDKLNKLADNDEEIQVLTAENQQLEKHLQSLQNQYNQSTQSFAKVTSELEQLRNQLPQRIEIDLLDIERIKAMGEAGNKVAKQIDESNQRLLEFQNKFISLTTQYSESLFRLKYPQSELQANQFLSPPPSIPPTQAPNFSQNLLEQQKLQLKSFQGELEGAIIKAIQKNRNLQTQEISQLLQNLQVEITKYLASKPLEGVQNSLNYLSANTQNTPKNHVENVQKLEKHTEENVENSDIYQQSREQTIVEPPRDEPLPSWVSYYNKSPESFSKEVSQNVIEVSETEDSIEQRRLGSNYSVVLEKIRVGRGSFWVFIDQSEIYLVPKIGVKINNYNIATVKCLFKVLGEPQGDYKFTLLKPAKVIQTKEQNWQLLESGVLQFEGE
ncbi:hypothetical protein NIES4071_60250 [Calothrix sp. NIES-4071]|nr:hypothetical protein NIES4071_60250 [Calothrix sp. NIES-4071]BAZ60332.1 hypothetical protein NIES4105_60200 [Calothrix sp. NIES-4105]